MGGETCHKIEFHHPPSAKLTFRHGGIKSLKNQS